MQERFVGGMLVRLAVVAQGDADDVSFGMFHDPDRRIGLAGREVFARGQPGWE